ncbi:hypothetical protein PPACK8108_LOCUS3054, partial [Phakopsora pachyrhizi]
MVTTLVRQSARSVRLAQRNKPQIRSVHIENSVGNTFPFKFRGEGQTRVKVASKVIAFWSVGFFLPFAIARYQMKKSGAW